MTEDVAGGVGVITDRLELADWRRQVSELYGVIRAEPDPVAAWARWREVRERLFRTHSQSPVPERERGPAATPMYYEYNPTLRTTADVQAADGAAFELPGSTSGHVIAERAGTARCSLGGTPLSLSMFWLLDYAGGFFLSFRDATCGDETYGAGRYLLDTAKGADLGAGDDGRLILDFNFSYQPSCSYDPRWSCPLPPRENWLTIPIRAGERLRS
ncbi:MAG TPA: DUF1684 domain-containing protein [Candidatus Saccharimonadales bacterium]|nr:DUF1684 domain-containing protein [Candidatus Saccharimonadales bacterium]